MRKVIANNAFETIMALVNCHVNYINVVVNVERKGAPALVVKVNTTNAPNWQLATLRVTLTQLT